MNTFNYSAAVQNMTSEQVHTVINQLEMNLRVERSVGNVKSAYQIARQISELTMALMQAESER